MEEVQQISKYLRRKLKELEPEFLVITVFVPKKVYADLADEYPDNVQRDTAVSFVTNTFPWETVINFTPVVEAEDGG